VTEKQQSSVAAKAQEQAVISRLQQVPLLARLPANFIQFIRKAAAPTPITAGQGLYILFKGVLSLRKDEEEVARVEPVSCAGVVSALTGDPQPEDVVAEEEGIVMHVAQQILNAALTKNLELFQRLSRNAINSLADQLTSANEAQSAIALERAQLLQKASEVEIDLNDARMIASMRGDPE
jgi:signal-transduction protein with cAMP-binding, CBS, and nucleotidyltransferase domain